jgi:DNA-directed RNA polymerase specialized sigma subunit
VSDEEVKAVNDAVGGVLGIPDRLERAAALAKLLEDWPDLHSQLREARKKIVEEMRSEKLTYREIGEALGMHYTRVRQIEKGQRGEKNRPKKKADPPAE